MFIGCKNAHPPGPVLALYAKDGGPSFQKGPGTYDPLVVDSFFKSHPDVLPSFVDHGVCSLKTDPMSDEATANGIVCRSAANASFGIGIEVPGRESVTPMKSKARAAPREPNISTNRAPTSLSKVQSRMPDLTTKTRQPKQQLSSDVGSAARQQFAPTIEQ